MKTNYGMLAVLTMLTVIIIEADTAYAQRRSRGERPFSARNREPGIDNFGNPAVMQPGEASPEMGNENRPFRRNPNGGLWGRQTRRQREMEEAAMQQWLQETEGLGNRDITQIDTETPTGRSVLRRNLSNPASVPVFAPRGEGLLANPNATIRTQRPTVLENILPEDKKPLREMTTEEITSLFDE